MTAINPPSYSKEGTIYNAYTDKPARAVTVKDVAKQYGVSEKEALSWLEKGMEYRHIRYSGKRDDMLFLDYEVQHFVETVVRAPRAPKSWRRGLDNLKNLLLINRDKVLERLQVRLDHEWNDIQRRANNFDDRSIVAYRRGIRDAIHILKTAKVESWDYVPQYGQKCWVGGCTGIIVKMDDEYITVAGTYHYAPISGEGRGYSDEWSFRYLRKDVEVADVRPWGVIKAPDDIIWDYEDINHAVNGYAVVTPTEEPTS